MTLDIQCDNCGHEYQADSMGYCPKCGSSRQHFENLPVAEGPEVENVALKGQLAEAAKQHATLKETYDNLLKSYEEQAQAHTDLQTKYDQSVTEMNEQLGKAMQTQDALEKERDALKKALDEKATKGDKK